MTGPPPGTPCVRTPHRVAFFETDAMRIVHHANCVLWFELARLDARFDDRVTIQAWLRSVGGASLGMNYRVECERRTLVTGLTEHACVDDDGRVRRIPAERRAGLRGLLAAQETDQTEA